MSLVMSAWVQTGFGGPDMRRRMQVARPVPAFDELLVKVVACALNRLDLLQRGAAVVQPFSLPHIAGMDISGYVVACGGAAGEALVGVPVVIDPVVVCTVCDHCRAGLPMYCRTLRTIGSTRAGGMAEYVAVPVRNCIAAMPSVTTLADLAAAPVAGVTAWHAMLTVGRIRTGETVVIPGAGSGLGSAGIQIARDVGCRVIAIVGDAAKMASARGIGADVVIDRSRQDWVAETRQATDGRGADLVWDHVGGSFLQQAIDACCLGGRVVMSGTTAGGESVVRNTSIFHWGRSLLGHGGYTPGEMGDVVGFYREGRLRSVIDSRWAFDDLPLAEQRLESDAFFGKILLCMPD